MFNLYTKKSCSLPQEKFFDPISIFTTDKKSEKYESEQNNRTLTVAPEVNVNIGGF